MRVVCGSMSVYWPNKLILAKERIDGATNIDVLGIPSARVQGGQRTVETNLGQEDRGQSGASPKSRVRCRTGTADGKIRESEKPKSKKSAPEAKKSGFAQFGCANKLYFCK